MKQLGDSRYSEASRDETQRAIVLICFTSKTQVYLQICQKLRSLLINLAPGSGDERLPSMSPSLTAVSRAKRLLVATARMNFSLNKGETANRESGSSILPRVTAS
jgi:hypothetical protein